MSLMPTKDRPTAATTVLREAIDRARKSLERATKEHESLTAQLSECSGEIMRRRSEVLNLERGLAQLEGRACLVDVVTLEEVRP